MPVFMRSNSLNRNWPLRIKQQWSVNAGQSTNAVNIEHI